MTNEEQYQHQMADHLRRAFKELRWAANNLASLYELIRPADMPPIEDPNQLKMFNDDNIRTDE